MVVQVQANTENETDKYLTYKGFGRKPLVWGIPLIPFVSIIFPLILSLFLGIRFMGMSGLIIPTILAFILFFLKMQCVNDSNALTKLYWIYKGFFLRLLVGSFTLKVSPTDKKITRKKLNEFYRQYSTKNKG